MTRRIRTRLDNATETAAPCQRPQDSEIILTRHAEPRQSPPSRRSSSVPRIACPEPRHETAPCGSRDEIVMKQVDRVLGWNSSSLGAELAELGVVEGAGVGTWAGDVEGGVEHSHRPRDQDVSWLDCGFLAGRAPSRGPPVGGAEGVKCRGVWRTTVARCWAQRFTYSGLLGMRDGELRWDYY
ncbi:hypothetical protein BKA56DRAFT_617399 [Ilyonectria sp. MPI-CAGE-AT-0026]|nr:hypothetical protein BKA56DRAFT_617399 [Ilyonectria sp. MPI-CAGE-AT-0026]